MPTFNEIGRDYANRVANAIRQDGFTKTASLTTGSLYRAHVVATLRDIGRELDTHWTIDGRPLSEEEKRAIAVETGRELGLDRPEEFNLAVKAASNDAYMELVDYVTNIVRKKG